MSINPEAKPIIVLTGGGTGGHITPILAVGHELKVLDASLSTVYIGEKGGKFDELTSGNPDIDGTFSVRAGKFRRYHGEGFFTRLFDVKTNLLNFRDLFYFLAGTVQAWRLLGKVKPSVVFMKGGFVGVPVGLAAAARHIPIVTHDSDAIPGLANRIVSRWARVHATAMPVNTYAYPAEKVQQVGVLVGHNYELLTPEKVTQYREAIGIPSEGRVLLVTGGSTGAVRVNEVFRSAVPQLLETFPDLLVIHVVGHAKQGIYNDFQHDRLKVAEFLTPFYKYTGASDVVLTRAGANTIAELGVQGKAIVVVPSPFLAGGHQLANAKYLAEQGAAVVVQEEAMSDPQQGLLATISDLLKNESRRSELGQTLHEQTIPDAAHRLAVILLDQLKA